MIRSSRSPLALGAPARPQTGLRTAAAPLLRAAGAAPWTCALVSAGLVALAGRPWGGGALTAVGWLAWVALVPLFAAQLAGGSWLRAGALGGVAALGLASVAYEPAAALGAGWYLFALTIGALPFAVAGAAGRLVARRLPPALGPLTLALFWAVAELLQAQPALLGLYALPLATLGYSQADLPALHLARFSSVTATSVALLLANAFALQLLLGAAARGRAEGSSSGEAAGGSSSRGRAGGLHPVVLPAAGLLVLAGLVAAARLTVPAPGAAGSLDVAVAQPNQPTSMLAAAQGVPPARRAVLARIAALGAQAARGGAPDLLVWPEGAWPGPLPFEDDHAALEPATLAPESRAALAALPPSIIGAAGRTPGGAATNSAFVWLAGQLAHLYDKVHLVPVGEAGLRAGAHVPVAPVGGVQVAPFICYDVAFPATVRAAALAGARLLAVLTDDAFAARGDVPHQHLRLARFRAVESGLPLAFASNTGPSALIGGDGEVAAASLADEATLLRARLGLGAGPTPYIRYGNWVGALACLGAVLLTGAAARSVAGTEGGVTPNQPSTRRSRT